MQLEVTFAEWDLVLSKYCRKVLATKVLLDNIKYLIYTI